MPNYFLPQGPCAGILCFKYSPFSGQEVFWQTSTYPSCSTLGISFLHDPSILGKFLPILPHYMVPQHPKLSL